MRNIYRAALAAIISGAFFLGAAGCNKSSGSEDCWTCRAYATDGGATKEEQVCSEAEETAFRNANAGKEISCPHSLIAFDPGPGAG